MWGLSVDASCNKVTIWCRKGFIRTTCYSLLASLHMNSSKPPFPRNLDKKPLFSAPLLRRAGQQKFPCECWEWGAPRWQLLLPVHCFLKFLPLIPFHWGLKSCSKTLHGGKNMCTGNIGAGRKPQTSTSGCSSCTTGMIYSAGTHGNCRDLLAWCLIHPAERVWWRAGENKE